MEHLKQASLDARRYKESQAFKNRKPNLLRKAFARVCGWPIWATLFQGYCKQLIINHQTISLATLPASFNGYRILFITDTHLEVTPNALPAFQATTLPEHDIVLLGGDLFDNHNAFCEKKLQAFLAPFTQQVYAILGNHDKSDIIEALEAAGVHVLLNTSTYLTREEDKVLLTGVDDVTYFSSEWNEQCVNDARLAFTGCAIMASHNPDFLTVAGEHNYDLQLSGHTHGGQFRIFNQVIFKETAFDFALSGHWQYKNMKGFTSTGFGSSRFPIRNILPEAVVITLTSDTP
jgi:predicted MPP superfamily phosphohydrolase